MSRRDDRTLLQDMIEAARSAVSAIEGREPAALAADHVRALGLVKCLEIVGEAAGRLSAGFRERLLEVMREIRDRFNPDLDVDAAATLTWSSVHGLAVLAPSLDDVAHNMGTRSAPLDEMVKQFTVLLMNGLKAR